MAKTSPKSATQIDLLIGQKIRAQRLLKGLTQTQLGETLGVTFQQIQKYENGTNRVGSGRLYQIADVLEVQVFTFFEKEKVSNIPRQSSPYGLLDDAMSAQMLKEFAKIKERETRRLVLALVERIAAGK
jgi:transcriptional regulator with XRE-family HTH domain